MPGTKSVPTDSQPQSPLALGASLRKVASGVDRAGTAETRPRKATGQGSIWRGQGNSKLHSYYQILGVSSPVFINKIKPHIFETGSKGSASLGRDSGLDTPRPGAPGVLSPWDHSCQRHGPVALGAP